GLRGPELALDGVARVERSLRFDDVPGAAPAEAIEQRIDFGFGARGRQLEHLERVAQLVSDGGDRAIVESPGHEDAKDAIASGDADVVRQAAEQPRGGPDDGRLRNVDEAVGALDAIEEVFEHRR